MWAGPNAPMRPPHGQAPPSLAPVRPHGAWYAVSAVLILLPILVFGGMLAGLLDDSNVASAPGSRGDPVNGFTVDLSQSHSYFIYVRGNAAAPKSCTLTSVGGGGDRVTLALSKKNSWSATDYPSYTYAATFDAPVSGQARITCTGATGELLVTPDDTVDAYLGFALLGGLFVGGIGVISVIVIAVRRRASRRRAATAWTPSPPPVPGGGGPPPMPPPGPFGG